MFLSVLPLLQLPHPLPPSFWPPSNRWSRLRFHIALLPFLAYRPAPGNAASLVSVDYVSLAGSLARPVAYHVMDTTPPPPPSVDLAYLNLDPSGTPLSWRSASTWPDSADWLKADEAEFRRLFSTSSWHVIHPSDQPADRRGDTTYYNKVTRVKIKDGIKDRRVRSTIGGDRINYPDSVSARTADLDIVKTLLQSVMARRG